ncbi:MAG TPA: hypothetical protein VHC86_12260 [Opitutaceae bacterium]|nr:hypothetical protein [Opitutaceae bacterium]
MTELIIQDLDRRGDAPRTNHAAKTPTSPSAVANQKPLLLPPVVVRADSQARKLQDRMDQLAFKNRPFSWQYGGDLNLGPVTLNLSYNPVLKGINLFSF